MLNKHEASFILFAFYQAYNLEKNFFLLAVFSLGRHLRRMSLRRMLLLGTCRHENKAYYTPDEHVETNELIWTVNALDQNLQSSDRGLFYFFRFFFCHARVLYLLYVWDTVLLFQGQYGQYLTYATSQWIHGVGGRLAVSTAIAMPESISLHFLLNKNIVFPAKVDWIFFFLLIISWIYFVNILRF